MTAPSAPDRLAEAKHAEVLAALATYDEATAGHWGVGAVRIKTWSRVLTSIAERHAPQRNRPDGPFWCWVCVDPDFPDERPPSSPWPCQTFRDVAAAVGVEVANA